MERVRVVGESQFCYISSILLDCYTGVDMLLNLCLSYALPLCNDSSLKVNMMWYREKQKQNKQPTHISCAILLPSILLP